MSDRFIEKAFLYLLVFSLLLHAALLAFIVYLPKGKKVARPEPIMVELRDHPELKADREDKPKRFDEQKQKSIQKEKSAPDKIVALPKTLPEPLMPPPSPHLERKKEADKPSGTTKREVPTKETPPSESILKQKKEALPDIAKLFPSAEIMANLEDTYRKKYEGKVGGDALFLDKDNDLLRSYSRRFLEAARVRWDQVSAPLFRNSEFGYGLVLITINRSGLVEDVQVVESSGNKKVDDGIIKAFRTMDYVGPLPKSWTHNKLKAYYVYTSGYEIN